MELASHATADIPCLTSFRNGVWNWHFDRKVASLTSHSVSLNFWAAGLQAADLLGDVLEGRVGPLRPGPYNGRIAQMDRVYPYSNAPIIITPDREASCLQALGSAYLGHGDDCRQEGPHTAFGNHRTHGDLSRHQDRSDGRTTLAACQDDPRRPADPVRTVAWQTPPGVIRPPPGRSSSIARSTMGSNRSCVQWFSRSSRRAFILAVRSTRLMERRSALARSRP